MLKSSESQRRIEARFSQLESEKTSLHTQLQSSITSQTTLLAAEQRLIESDARGRLFEKEIDGLRRQLRDRDDTQNNNILSANNQLERMSIEVYNLS